MRLAPSIPPMPPGALSYSSLPLGEGPGVRVIRTCFVLSPSPRPSPGGRGSHFQGSGDVRPRGGSAARGFTLMEILLALAIISGVVLGVLGFYRSVADSRREIVEHAEVIGAQRAVMQMLTEELRSALAYRFLNLGVEGGWDAIRFPTTRVPGPGVWVQRDLTDRPIPPEHDLHVVGYRPALWEREDGTLYIAGIERTRQQVVTARAPEEGDEIEIELLTPHVRFVFFEYYDGTEWRSGWGGGDLPAAVRITLGHEPLDEQLEPEEYPHPIMQRVVFIPGGITPQGGGVAGRGR